MGTLVGGSGAGRPTSARPVSATSALSFAVSEDSDGALAVQSDAIVAVVQWRGG